MQVCFSTPIEDFLDDVRYRAAQSGATPAVIDKLDELLAMPNKDAEIEKLGEELSAMEGNRDDLAEALRDVEKIFCDRELDGPTIKEALTLIENALSRSA